MSTYETTTLWVLWITALAALAGPIAAVFITRWSDDRKEKIRRKSAVFSRLMGTRSQRTSIDHVSALNLVQVEFHDVSDVVTAYRNYIAHLSTQSPKVGQELQKFIQDRGDLFMDLMHEMAKNLGYSFDKRDLDRLSYGPQAWFDDEEAIRMMRSHLMAVLSNSSPLQVVLRAAPPPSASFPPPPDRSPQD